MPVAVTYKKVRNLNLRLRSDGSVVASAPHRTARRTIESFLDQRGPWIALMQRRQAQRQAASHQALRDGPSDLAALADHVSQLIDHLAPKLGSRRPSRVTFKRMKTRWGSCNRHLGTVNLNVQLAAMPTWAIEYVVAHELTHLYHGGHGEDFWAALGTIMPDCKKRRRLLRQYAALG